MPPTTVNSSWWVRLSGDTSRHGAWSVLVPVMRVRPMRMRVDLSIVFVRVGMGPNQCSFVAVPVMAVVVGVRVIVLQLVVSVLVAVLFGQMQHHASEQEHRGYGCRDARRLVAEHERSEYAEERCDREH